MGNRRAPSTAFKPGQSGNPGGRPKILQNVKALAQARTEEAVEALVQALKKPGERVHAATILLAYGYGRPVQNVQMRVIRGIEDLSEEELVALTKGNGTEDGRGTRH
jgi:hypothetical protein